MSAMDILPKQARKKSGAIDISFKEPHLVIGIRTQSCDVNDPSSYGKCGLVVQDGDACTCFTYVKPFNLETTFYLDKLMSWMKLPSRAFMYAQMKYWPKPVTKATTDIFCESSQEECFTEVTFGPNARILRWSWFGNVPKSAFTPEGIALVSIIVAAATLGVVVSRPKSRSSGKNTMIDSFLKVNRVICGAASRS